MLIFKQIILKRRAYSLFFCFFRVFLTLWFFFVQFNKSWAFVVNRTVFCPCHAGNRTLYGALFFILMGQVQNVLALK